MEHEELATPGPRRPSARLLVGAGLVAAGVVAGATLGSLGVAGAQTQPTPAPSATASDGPRKAHPFKHGVGPHKGGLGLGRGAIHGEFTTRGPDGGFQTLATQHGDVTAVSASSITVKSEDGYSRTYRVDDNTLVNAGNDGIADVKVGDTVHVVATVSGGTASAVQVDDGTNIRRLRERWRPAKPARPAPSATPTA